MELRLRGLDGPVEVLRDSYGVPHCQAVSEHDAFFAQGFVHAVDRLWQMDYDRRRGLGRSAEVTGTAGVTGDALYRRLGLAAAVQRDLPALSAGARDMLAAYSSGVNALIGMSRAGDVLPGWRPPAEFELTGQLPEPWEPWHSLLVYRVRHMTMGSAAPKLWRAVVAEALGPAAARKMARTGWQLACVPPGERCDATVPSWTGLEDSGSNNWALAGSRTASGLPLLAGDPHRPLEMPNVYVQGHVACPEWDVLGLGMAGVPGFPHFGHNDRVAWCITHGMADDQDLYRTDGTTASGRTELIDVLGSDPVRIEVGESARGPMIADNLALAWTATAGANAGFDALPAMLAVRSVSELFATMRTWVEPVNNVLAADTDGNIGYLTRGHIPIRTSPEAAWGPVPGADPAYGWRGFVSFADLPQVHNPAGGFLFSANNRILAAADGPYLGLDVAPPWRASRIIDTISGLSRATVADMAALHRDVVSLPARRIARLLADWPPLAGWDGQLTADSPGAAAYSVLRRELALLLLERSGLTSFIEHPWNRLLPGIRAESVVWRVAGEHLASGDESLLGGWSWRRALTEAIRRAELAWAGESWGELHATGQRHPLRRAGLDPPSVPYGGDMETVQASSYLPVEGLRTTSGSVARYAFDVADWDSSAWIVPLGAAGEPGSRHAYDQQEAWRTGVLLPAPYSRQAVEAMAAERHRLLPA